MRTESVGHITRWGKLVGNHHLATGHARPVTVLKGVNMVFRREALALPAELRGSGAQVHHEVAICLWAVEQGWRLVFDPEAQVDHQAAQRFDIDARDAPAPRAVVDAAYNLVFGMLSLRPALAGRRAAYGLLVGDRMTPGIVRGLAAGAQRDWTLVRQTIPSMGGQLAALAAFARGRRISMVALPHES
jgi:hypothetical protein